MEKTAQDAQSEPTSEKTARVPRPATKARWEGAFITATKKLREVIKKLESYDPASAKLSRNDLKANVYGEEKKNPNSSKLLFERRLPLRDVIKLKNAFWKWATVGAVANSINRGQRAFWDYLTADPDLAELYESWVAARNTAFCMMDELISDKLWIHLSQNWLDMRQHIDIDARQTIETAPVDADRLQDTLKTVRYAGADSQEDPA